MMPPLLQQTAQPRPLRIMLIVFAVRHLVGVGLFVLLTLMGRDVAGPFWIVMAILTVAYGGYAAYAWNRLRGQYIRSLARQAENTVGSGAPHAD